MTENSSLDAINQAIKELNPFESNFIAKAHHVWDDEFLDLPCLHVNAFEEILQAIDKINCDRLKTKATGFALIASKGAGKTHILSRVRQHIKRTGEGFFIYACEYGDLSSIKNQFLQSLAFSLKKTGSKGVMQWQELASVLVSQGLEKEIEPQKLIEQFPKALAKNPQVVNQLTQKVLQKYPDVDNPYIIKAILWTLSQAHAPFVINWIAGRELSEAQATMMDLPNLNKEDREAEAFNIARQVLDLISNHTTPIICFDELDGTELADEDNSMLAGYTRAQVVGSLVKDIYNNLKRGVLITAMYPKTWNEEFKSVASVNAIKDRVAHKELELNLLKPDDAVVLVAYLLEDFYSKQGLTPPNAIYPFDESQLRELGNGSTVRDILQWCATNFSPATINPVKQLEKIYQQIELTLEDFADDNRKIANAIAFGLHHLRGQTVEGITIKKLDREVHPKSRHRGCINFRILGEEQGKEVKIGVCVSQDSHGRTVGAAIKYLTLYKDFDLTRGCLVRSKSVQSNWRVARTSLDQLLNQQGGEWVSFKDEEIKPLLTLHKMSKELDREVFTNTDFEQFINEKHPFSNNPLIQEILSDPSGQNPREVIDEDNELEKLFSEELANTSESDEESEALELLSVA